MKKRHSAAVVRLEFLRLDSCNELFWRAPVFGNLQEAAPSVMAVAWTANELAQLLVPNVSSARTVESGSCIPSAEVLEHSMDVALACIACASSSGLAIVAAIRSGGGDAAAQGEAVEEEEIVASRNHAQAA